MKDGDFIRIRQTDTGQGISPENLPLIFDPFFTTKPVGQGTGLGLSISKGIVKSHGGDITCASLPGSGATFEILLPITQVIQ
jgi:signal transduction histidine kinase